MVDQASTADLERWVRTFARLIGEQKGHLTDLDAAIGDADHGANMDRGMRAVVAALDGAALAGAPLDGTAPWGASALFKKVGMTLVSTVGGASGPLYGTFFLRLAAAIGEAEPVPRQRLAAAVRAGLDGVVARGKAEAGDKTMVDALGPAVAAIDASSRDERSLDEVFAQARKAADSGRDATTAMLARKGRASYLGERSIGHQDPGATSVALLFAAADEVF